LIFKRIEIYLQLYGVLRCTPSPKKCKGGGGGIQGMMGGGTGEQCQAKKAIIEYFALGNQ